MTTRETSKMADLIENSIENRHFNTLKEIKKELSSGIPIELMHIDDRIMIERIDNYLNN